MTSIMQLVAVLFSPFERKISSYDHPVEGMAKRHAPLADSLIALSISLLFSLGNQSRDGGPSECVVLMGGRRRKI